MSTLATDTAGLRLPGPLEAAVLEGKEVWPVAPDRPPLTSEEVHVWRFVLDLEDGGASRLEAILEPRERERAVRFAGQGSRDLWYGTQAQRRLYQTPDTFGKCEQCGEEIGFDGLDALPHARLCIKCKAKEEDGKRR